MQRHLEGHFGDVYTCRFFPSGVVILSGGADTQLKIWSAETGQCAATLIGHTAGITRLLVTVLQLIPFMLLCENEQLTIKSCSNNYCRNMM